MRLGFISLAFLVGLNSCMMEPSAEEDIAETLLLQQEAWNEGDITGFMNYYLNSEDLTFAGVNGVTKGHKQVLKRYLRNYDTPEKMGILNFSVLEFHQLSNNSAYLIGEWSLQREADNPSGYFTLVWEQINGKLYTIILVKWNYHSIRS